MDKKSVSAFAPASISFFVKLYGHENPRWAGSYGVGATLREGVVVEVKKSVKTKISFNNKKVIFPTVLSVIKKLTNENIEASITSPLPLGAGFALSGAAALATAYATNKLFSLGKSKKDLAVLSHIAEIENKTGAGNIVNQYYGGMFLKRKPSSHFIVERIPISNTYVYYKYFGKLATPAILSNTILQDKIERAGS